jgi:nucleoside-diphosphate-sugar epimerase
MSTRVLVTGSSGFIGQHLIDALLYRGERVLAIDVRPPPPRHAAHFERCDIVDLASLQPLVSAFRPEILVHLAARTDLDEKQHLSGYAANIEGTRNVIRAIKEAGSVSRALFTSSQLVCRVGYVPKNDTDYCPDNLYGESKVLTEKIVREADLSSLSWCLLRPTTIWGEGMSPHYQRFLGLIRRGRYVHVGSARQSKSYGYVGNAVVQYLRFMDATAAIHGRTFYVADYQPLQLREWVDGLAEAMHVRPPHSIPLPLARVLAATGDIINACGFRQFAFNSFRLKNILTEYVFDLSATAEVCGELPFSMQQGITRTVQWYVGQAAAQGSPR